MNSEILEILSYIEYDSSEEIFCWLEEIKNMDSSAAPQEAQEIAAFLKNIIDGRILANQYHLGYYHLFLGCASQDIGDYDNALYHFNRFRSEAKGSCVNEAMARWLLSVVYLQAGEVTQAQSELESALSVIKNNPVLKRDRERYKFFVDRIQQALRNPQFPSRGNHFISPSSRFARAIQKGRNVVKDMFGSTPPVSPEPESTPPQPPTPPPTRASDVDVSQENHKRGKIHVTVPVELDIDVDAGKAQIASDGDS